MGRSTSPAVWSSMISIRPCRDRATLDEFLSSERGRLIPAVAAGAVAATVGVEEEDSVSPSALTLPWSLPWLVEKLAEATAVAKG